MGVLFLFRLGSFPSLPGFITVSTLAALLSSSFPIFYLFLLSIPTPPPAAARPPLSLSSFLDFNPSYSHLDI